MTPPVPIPYPHVQAHLHGGPHDAETLALPWALTQLSQLDWEGEEMVESLYRLSSPWRGQSWAHYTYVE